jgi:N-acetylglucosaminyldiphosphoundecaprenol N-acetyl-beta-D-mannosaminyltransferase
VTQQPPRPLLGRLLLDRGLLTREELQLALEESERTGRPLGGVILDLRLVTPPALADVLAAQQAWRPLGRMLVERGLLTEDELADVLAEQEQSGRRLGDIVKARSLAAAASVDQVIAEQYRLEVELEHGFGAGLRGEIERRHRLARHGQTEDAAQAVTPEPGPNAPKRRRDTKSGGNAERIRVLQAALDDRERSLAALGASNQRKQQELEQLRTELRERDALIAAFEQRLQGSGAYVDDENVHRLAPAADGY